MSESKLFLGIDTSNYTTSVALCDEKGKVVLNLKQLLPVAEGERGLRQSDALFAHTKNLPCLMDSLRDFLDRNYPERQLVGIGYSKTPRDVEGSYMPCFLSGVSAAHSIAATVGATLYPFSHQGGHIMAALYSASKTELLDGNDRFVAFHVSGGTTDILLVSPYENGFSVERIGGSADINAGQAIDRTGVRMGMKFPCGKEMDELCSTHKIPKSKTKISVRGLDCNLSGLENLAAELYKKTEDRELVSAYCFDFIADTLGALTTNIREIYPNIPIIYAGGVMSNSRIKAQLSAESKVYFSEPQFSSDNAAGVALLARKAYIKEK